MRQRSPERSRKTAQAEPKNFLVLLDDSASEGRRRSKDKVWLKDHPDEEPDDDIAILFFTGSADLGKEPVETWCADRADAKRLTLAEAVKLVGTYKLPKGDRVWIEHCNMPRVIFVQKGLTCCRQS